MDSAIAGIHQFIDILTIMTAWT